MPSDVPAEGRPIDQSLRSTPDTSSRSPAPVSPPARAGNRLLSVTVVVATLGVVVALIGVGWLLRPLSSPTQDCGTAWSFLATGQTNIFVDPTNPPKGITGAEATANNANPCQARAGERAKPAGALVVGGTLLALAAAVVDGIVRFRRHRRRGWSSVSAALNP